MVYEGGVVGVLLNSPNPSSVKQVLVFNTFFFLKKKIYIRIA